MLERRRFRTLTIGDDAFAAIPADHPAIATIARLAPPDAPYRRMQERSGRCLVIVPDEDLDAACTVEAALYALR
jgi:hypothetical protein